MATPIKNGTKTPVKTSPSVASSVKGDEDAAQAMKKLDTKLKAINANSIARVSNSHLVSADEKLAPLLSLKTGRPIDRFPETPKGIAKLSLTLVDATLLALEAERTGKEDEKRERLRVQIGLKPNPA